MSAMNFQAMVASLARFADILPAIIGGVSASDAVWKPASGNWSILEIVCHLADEEVEDFRPRVRLTLEDPTQTWPPIDPAEAAVERRYNEQDLHEALARFLRERADSISWLNTLTDANWDIAYDFPNHGPVPAGEVLASWAAHDHLHLRQIAKRLYEINERDSGDYGVQYAGGW